MVRRFSLRPRWSGLQEQNMRMRSSRYRLQQAEDNVEVHLYEHFHVQVSRSLDKHDSKP